MLVSWKLWCRCCFVVLLLPCWVQAGEEAGERKSRDRGELRMSINDVLWQSRSAKVSKRKGGLQLKASRMDGDPTKSVIRQSLQIDLTNYQGPGEYISEGMSAFTVVGMNTAAMEAGDMDAELASVLSRAKHSWLKGIQVTIESDDGKEVRGHFSPGAVAGSALTITDGTFRALIRQ